MIKVYNITKADIITGPQLPINKNVYEHILQRKESHLSKIKWLQQIMYFLTQNY